MVTTPNLLWGVIDDTGSLLEALPPITPEPTDTVPDEPDPQPGDAGRRLQVIVQDFPSGTRRGQLHGVNVLSWSRPGMSGNLPVPGELHASLPLDSPWVAHVLGTGDYETYRGIQRRDFDPINWELLLCVNGVLTERYVVRDPPTINGNTWEVTGKTKDVLVNDRIIGPATRIDLLGGRGSFDGSKTLGELGWRIVGDVTATIVSGGARGTHSVSIKGTPDGTNFLEISQNRSADGDGTGQANFVHAAAFVKLPASALDGYGLLSVEVINIDTSTIYWPPLNGAEGDPLAADSDTNMPLGAWSLAPIDAGAKTPPPPYNISQKVRLYPVDETDAVQFDEVVLIQNDTTSTTVPKDLIYHPTPYFREAQLGRDKSDWGITTHPIEATGIVELGFERHADRTPMPETLSKISDRDGGPAQWPTADNLWHVSRRRGQRRYGVTIRPHDVLAAQGWTLDPGDFATAVIGTSAAGGIYGGYASSAIDTSQTNGQIIDFVVQAPNDLTPNQLDGWTREVLKAKAQRLGTTRLVLRGAHGRRINVGDTLSVHLAAGSGWWAGLMQATSWTEIPASDTVVIDFAAATS